MARLVFALTVILSVTACSYAPGALDDPVRRRLSWFGFVGGSDIRAGCGPAAPDHYRLVYTANYEDQVRIYELASGVLTQRVIEQPGLLLTWAADDQGLTHTRSRTGRTALSPGQVDEFRAALAASGLFAAPPGRLDLPSYGYHWLVTACQGGRFFVNGWLYPSERFARLAFPAVLARWDVTGTPLPAPRSLPPRFADPDARIDFTLTLGSRGLVGVP